MILVIGLVWTALYISFTEAGIEEILGTQARYYYPFIFIFYLCFQTDKIKNTIELEKYQMMIMVITFTASMLSLMITISLASRKSFDAYGKLREVMVEKKGKSKP